jgi:hypothetical protein
MKTVANRGQRCGEIKDGYRRLQRPRIERAQIKKARLLAGLFNTLW